MDRRKVSIDDLAPAELKREDGWKKMDIRFLISDETVGTHRVCFWRTVLAPGAAHEKHRHMNSEEVMYCISGHGAEGIGDQEYELRPGVAVFIPKGEVHWTRNLSRTEPLEFVGLYTDAGNLKESDYVFVSHLEEEELG
ncbi:MAG: cupin domain-containing protein [Deinococcus sp.]|nr:cupin domain-containing protein [Deinococcus sp.]